MGHFKFKCKKPHDNEADADTGGVDNWGGENGSHEDEGAGAGDAIAENWGQAGW